MNRILQAEVILTLTLVQAAQLAALLQFARRRQDFLLPLDYLDMVEVVSEQFAKQGVQL